MATGIRCDKGEVEEERKADGTDVRCLLNVKTWSRNEEIHEILRSAVIWIFSRV